MNIPNIRLFAELGLLHMKNVLLEEELEAARAPKPTVGNSQSPAADASPVSEPSSDGIQQ